MNYNGNLQVYCQIRAAELGCADFTLRYRAFKFRADGGIDIQTGNDLFILADADSFVKIQSDNGLYERENALITEDQVEHYGQISITANSNELPPDKLLKVAFWQLIPLQRKVRKS